MKFTASVVFLFLAIAVEVPGQARKPATHPTSRQHQSAAKQPTAAASRSRAALDPNSELQRRYNALNAATASGDPEAVASASRKVLALALRQTGNLRMLVEAYPEAAELYRRSLTWEENTDTHLDLAIALLRNGQIDAALPEIASVLAADPQNARAWHVQGRAQVLKKDYRAAAESLDRSLALKRDVNAEYALGSCFLLMGETAKAQQVFQGMLNEYGDRAIWHVVFAGAYREAHMLQDAAREFRRAIALDNNVDNAHFYLGLTLLEQNMWARTDESMAAFREAVRQHPNDFSANFYLGVGESQLQLFADSNKHLRTCASLQPNVPEVWLYLGLNAFQERNYPEAKKALEKTVELTGADEARNNYQIRRAYIALGRIYFTEGDKQESDRWIAKAKAVQGKSLELSAETIAETTGGGMAGAAAAMPQIEVPKQSAMAEQPVVDATAPIAPSSLAEVSLSPADREQIQVLDKQLRNVISSAYNDWGTADARRGLYLQALERFHEAEQWDRTTPGLMRNIGMASLKSGNLVEALRALKVAVQVDPKDQMARARLAMLLFRTDQYAEAAEHFQALGAAAYSDPAVAYSLSYSLVRLNQPKQAIEALNRLSSMNLPADVLMSVGDLYALLEDYEHAIGSYRRALQLDPNTPNAHFKLGASLMRLERAEAAIPELQTALKLSPDNSETKYYLAYALLETSRKSDGLAMLQQVVSANPNYAEAQYLLGKTLVTDGQFDPAIQHLENAVRLNPESSYAHYQLQIAYRRAGRVADADREAGIYRQLKNKKREQAVIPQPEQKQ